MLMTLIQKEIMHHILSIRFVALLLMCLLLVPLTLHINYRNYLQKPSKLPRVRQTIRRRNRGETAGYATSKYGSFQTFS